MEKEDSKIYFYYDADNEEPNCGRCDNQMCDYLCEKCGSFNGWRYYRRTETLEIKEDK